mmetsp:Transcript_23132/g.34651  ORF Transcript_23132/g.34651 Transcript_23132/m.34651 type:complete len:271 (+) Transcript_23132:2641-3453(+)
MAEAGVFNPGRVKKKHSIRYRFFKHYPMGSINRRASIKAKTAVKGTRSHYCFSGHLKTPGVIGLRWLSCDCKACMSMKLDDCEHEEAVNFLTEGVHRKCYAEIKIKGCSGFPRSDSSTVPVPQPRSDRATRNIASSLKKGSHFVRHKGFTEAKEPILELCKLTANPRHNEGKIVYVVYTPLDEDLFALDEVTTYVCDVSEVRRPVNFRLAKRRRTVLYTMTNALKQQIAQAKVDIRDEHVLSPEDLIVENMERLDEEDDCGAHDSIVDDH